MDRKTGGGWRKGDVPVFYDPPAYSSLIIWSGRDLLLIQGTGCRHFAVMHSFMAHNALSVPGSQSLLRFVRLVGRDWRD